MERGQVDDVGAAVGLLGLVGLVCAEDAILRGYEQCQGSKIGNRQQAVLENHAANLIHEHIAREGGRPGRGSRCQQQGSAAPDREVAANEPGLDGVADFRGAEVKVACC